MEEEIQQRYVESKQRAAHWKAAWHAETGAAPTKICAPL